MSYTYVLERNQYRDNDSGEFLSEQEILGYVDEIVQSGTEQASQLAGQYADGKLSAADLVTALKVELKTTTLQQAFLGRGGRGQMTQSDWGSLGRQLRLQYRDLRRLQNDLETKDITVGRLRQRTSLYFQRTREAFERANAKAFGLPPLPAYPGDLSTQCQAGCQCHWLIEKLPGNGNFHCAWVEDPNVENCEHCSARSTLWSSLSVVNGVLQPFTDVRLGAVDAAPNYKTVGDALMMDRADDPPPPIDLSEYSTVNDTSFDDMYRAMNVYSNQ